MKGCESAAEASGCERPDSPTQSGWICEATATNGALCYWGCSQAFQPLSHYQPPFSSSPAILRLESATHFNRIQREEGAIRVQKDRINLTLGGTTQLDHIRLTPLSCPLLRSLAARCSVFCFISGYV